MFSRKKKGNHTVSGEFYHWSYIIAFLSIVDMSILHWKKSQVLFYFTLLSYGLASLGYVAVINKWKNWMSVHIGGMLGSYIGLITTTIVVNVHRIPVLCDLPLLIFWFLPAIIGIPIIFKVKPPYRRM